MSETILINHTNERHDQDVISIYDMHIVQVRVAKGVIKPMTMKKRSEKGETTRRLLIRQNWRMNTIRCIAVAGHR